MLHFCAAFFVVNRNMKKLGRLIMEFFKRLFSGTSDDKIVKSDKTSIVVIGMERSAFAGRCSGAELDSKRMYNLLKEYSDDITYFTNEEAKKNDVKSAMEKAMQNDLAIIYYSGHGGSQHFANTGPEEADGKDEFLCLYDNPMIDNEIWQLLKQAKGRVFLIFDCCHSSTMFRVPNPFAKKEKKEREFEPGRTEFVTDEKIRAVQWAGCHETTVSWGSSAGGMFTNALRKYYKQYLTYDELWDKIAHDDELLESEIPYRTIISNGNNYFGNEKVFK